MDGYIMACQTKVTICIREPLRQRRCQPKDSPGFIHHQHRLLCKMLKLFEFKKTVAKNTKKYTSSPVRFMSFVNEVGSYPHHPTPSTGCYVASLP